MERRPAAEVAGWLELREAGEAQDRMQLDAVPSDAFLPVEVVEECDADDTGLGAHPHRPSRGGHLLPPLGRRTVGAEGGWGPHTNL